MKTRCYKQSNKDYKHYGGRGIIVCAEWKNDFAAFFKWAKENGYSDDLTLERKDCNGDYCPNNCMWVTIQEQQRNKRNSRRITHNNETRTLAEWAQFVGVSRKTMEYRIKKWGIDKAICTPVNVNKQKAKTKESGENQNA